ncbi:MAG TPA: magnesium-translocating P-type ATPase [Polyangiaceae bacterium]|nr:magnesium-translocating P-type ATPase [Polyangiaceae bacterium]
MALRKDSSEAGTKASGRSALLPLGELLRELGTSPAGLGSGEATARLEHDGPNDAASGRSASLRGEWLRTLANPLLGILLFAGVASAILGQHSDVLIIAAIVVSSSALDLWQTTRSRRAVTQLQSRVAPTAKVVRDGGWVVLPRSDVVTGDVVRLSAGDLVPADLRLLQARDLHVHQSALTGESLPVEKTAVVEALSDGGPSSEALLFLGTSVVSGSATAVVVATGRRTAFGDVISRLGERPDETEFERGMKAFGNLILRTVFVLVLFILVVHLSFGRNALESLLFAVALAVGLTPEFLPLITTVTLAEGALAMARQKVIVKHLASIQNLGSIDILCSDKTGTITSGEMSLDASLDPLGAPAERPLAFGCLNSAFQTGLASPLDAAILAASRPSPGYEKTDEIPFDFERRRLSVVLRRDAELVMISKGAPEGILDGCTHFEAEGKVEALSEAELARCREAFQRLSQSGFRVLAVAYRAVERPDGHDVHDEREMTLLGYLTFADHLLEGTRESIARLQRDGVSIKILTGDNELVTAHVCRQAGLDVSSMVLGPALEDLDTPALARVAEQNTVFARLSPAGKHRIIRALKSHGHTVGFLGDGINDAPSLHGADVGISVAGAVDVAREASDIILLESHLDVLHAGIIAGRRAFANVLKYLLMGTSSNFGNMLSMAGAAVVLPFLPMLPTQLLLNNFLYDVSQVTIPSDRVDPALLEKPARWDVRNIQRFMLVIGPVSSVYDFLTFWLLLRAFKFGEVRFRTGWFVESLVTQTLVLFVIRTMDRPWKSKPSALLTVTTLSVVAIAVLLPALPFAPRLGFEPLPVAYLPTLVLLVATYLAIVELIKRRVLVRLLP